MADIKGLYPGVKLEELYPYWASVSEKELDEVWKRIAALETEPYRAKKYPRYCHGGKPYMHKKEAINYEYLELQIANEEFRMFHGTIF